MHFPPVTPTRRPPDGRGPPPPSQPPALPGLRRCVGLVTPTHSVVVSLSLHGAVDGDMPAPDPVSATALGFTMLGNDVAAARQFVEKAGWRILRAPDASDEGLFYIYGDLDGNPINLVGERR